MHWIIPNETEIDSVAKAFLKHCSAQKHFAFHGEMGSGKTTFIKALVRALGS